MNKYSIISIENVIYQNHSVIRVTAKKKYNFLVSLFSSSKDVYFILSEESPLTMEAKSAKSSNNFWEVEKSMFDEMTINCKSYHVENQLDIYEKRKECKAEPTRKKEEDEGKAREAAEAKKKTEEENKKKENDLFANATIHKVNLSGFRAVVDENDDFSQQMSGIAGNVNMSFNLGDKQGFFDNVVLLYNKVHGYNSHLLKTLDAKHGQIVGLAFIKMALYFTNGNFQVNEIAAQNAYYCIVKNFLSTKNTYALPALFTLLMKKSETLVDELYSVNPDSSLDGWGGMSPSADYSRQIRTLENRLYIMKFLLPKFYNENNKNFTIDTTLPYHIPSEGEVEQFLQAFNSKITKKKKVYATGEKFFKSLYDDIDEQLNL